MPHRRFVVIALGLSLAGCADEPATVSPTTATTTAPPPATAPADAGAPSDPASAATTRPGPSTPPATATAPAATTSDDDDSRVARFLGFTAPKPAVWLWHPPENRMRAANYVVPATSGYEQAHLVVFQGIGGSAEMNIARWRGQFRDTDHTPVEAHLTELEADGLAITLVELQGERMKMGDGWYTPNQLLLAAIVHAPGGDIHIMLQGQYETVHANRDAFMTFLEGLRRDAG